MKEAEKANELRHALEDENQRLTDEVNEKIGNLEDVQERVADAEDELAELEPKHAQAKKDIEDADKVKEKYPNFYANCERAWQTIQNKRDASKDRARRLMDMVAEWDKPKDDEDQYY